MAYKTLIFGTDDLYPKLKLLYEAEVQRGNLEIVATVDATGSPGEVNIDDVDLAIISSQNDFYNLMKHLEGLGVPRNKIIDGRVFKIPHLDFSRLLAEGVAYGIFESKSSFSDKTNVIYPRVYKFKTTRSITVKLGVKSRINSTVNFPAHIEGGDNSIITIGNFSSIARGLLFEVNLNVGHNHHFLTSYHPTNFDWEFPKTFRAQRGICKINIGSDVWIGRGCILKCTNPNKPLVIGDGAVIASDSVVVKNVPPYAIVGGNPAQIIKYRFEPHIIESLLRIKWWDWSLDKIHDNFKHFNDIDKFIALYDK